MEDDPEPHTELQFSVNDGLENFHTSTKGRGEQICLNHSSEQKKKKIKIKKDILLGKTVFIIILSQESEV